MVSVEACILTKCYKNINANLNKTLISNFNQKCKTQSEMPV